MQISFAFVVALLTALGLAFGISEIAFRKSAQVADFGSLEFLRVSRLMNTFNDGYRVVGMLMMTLALAAALFLFVSSAVGLVVLKRRGLSNHHMVGLRRMRLISFFLFVGMVIRYFQFLLLFQSVS